MLPTTPSQFFFIDYRPGSDWWLSILTRASNSKSPVIRERLQGGWEKSPGYELSLALGTRLRLLPIVIARLNQDLAEMVKQLDERPTDVEWAIRARGAFTLRPDQIVYQLVADLDAFLFETRSLYEITGRLLAVFSACILGRPQTEQAFVDVLEKARQDVRWIHVLRDDRVHFFHQGAPWLAVEATGVTPPYGLLILRRNTKDLSDPGDWRRLSEYRGILDGYHKAVQRLSEWTREQIKDFEQKEGS